jgi:hypothetical protein
VGSSNSSVLSPLRLLGQEREPLPFWTKPSATTNGVVVAPREFIAVGSKFFYLN